MMKMDEVFPDRPDESLRERIVKVIAHRKLTQAEIADGVLSVWTATDPNDHQMMVIRHRVNAILHQNKETWFSKTDDNRWVLSDQAKDAVKFTRKSRFKDLYENLTEIVAEFKKVTKNPNPKVADLVNWTREQTRSK
jgi:hypothetical protein